jgi:hypothetical protein
MNVAIIGGSSGFGADLAAHIVKPHNQLVFPITNLLTLGKEELDLNDGEWVKKLRMLLTDRFGGPSAATVVVLMAYDRTNQQENMQLRVANTLYEIYRKSQTHLILVGDMRHHLAPPDSLYVANKRDLWRCAMKMATDPQRKSPITLYEPYTTGIESVSELALRVAPGVPGEFYCVTHIMRHPSIFERIAS